ncbi:hypothetical protein SARC_15491, partial [Sphaeroforma arctica JP610]
RILGCDVHTAATLTIVCDDTNICVDADMDDDNESGKAGVFETNKDDFFGDL